jgi:ribosomal protein S18 acetylase RimI-like enzyme
MVTIIAAQNPAELAQARTLFLEYAASLDVDLAVQGFDAEQAALPGKYAPPRGGLWLACRSATGEAIGTVGIRPFDWPESCEVKRLYVRPAGRGGGAGRLLMDGAIGFARQAGYGRMLLDSLPSMAAAIGLYRSLGFAETGPYWNSPIPGVRYFCKQLA